MNRLLLLTALILAASLAVPSTGMADDRSDLSDRMRTQWSAIERGVSTGTLPVEEGNWLKRELRTVRIEAEILRRKETASPIQESMLHARLDQVADTIRCSLSMYADPRPSPAIAAR